MEFITRLQPGIPRNWKVQDYEEIAAASQLFQSENTLS
jgi:hypothetical protein